MTTSRSDRPRLMTVQHLLYLLREERNGESEQLMKEVWENLPQARLTDTYKELDLVIGYLEERERTLTAS